MTEAVADSTTLELVHIGDTHLRPNDRQQDRIAALDAIIAQNSDRPRLGAWLWPGDLFDTRSTPEDRNIVAEMLQRMAAVAPVVIVRGNHDAPGDLDIFERLHTTHAVHVVHEPSVITVETPQGITLYVVCLPYLHRGQFIHTPDWPEWLTAQLSTLRAELEALIERPKTAACLAAHMNISGAITSTGQPQIGREIEIQQHDLDQFQGIYQAFNHIHKHQVIGPAVYAGSICRMDFGEMEPKGYVRATITRPRCTFQFLPLAVPNQLHFETPDGVTILETYRAEDVKGADIRLRCQYDQNLLPARDMLTKLATTKAYLLSLGARSVKTESIAFKVDGTRAPSIMRAVTLPEKAQLYLKARGQDWTPELAAAFEVVQSPDPDDIWFVHTAESINAEVARED